MSTAPATEAEVKLNMTRLSVVLAVLLGVVSLLGAWLILPYRVGEAEKRIVTLEANDRTQQEILIRIDENVKLLREEQRKKP